MASRTGTFAAPVAGNSAALAGPVSRCLVRMTLGLFLLLFTILVTRHNAGMLKQPVPAGGLIGLGVLLAALFAWFHGTYWTRFTRYPLTLLLCLEWLMPLLLAILVFLSITLPGSSQVALEMMWGLIGMSELSWSIALLIARRRYRTRVSESPVPDLDVSTKNQVTDSEVDHKSPDVPAAELIQQMTRTVQTNGGELILVSTQAKFEIGQRTETVHLAFCPPLEQLPAIECNQIDGPPCRIKTAESQIYGARFEIRLLDRFQHPVQVRFQVEAATNPSDT